jgi:hypothetical protein
MKTVLALLALAVAAPLAASPTLPGVSDEESDINFLPLTKFEQGNGDVLFVRDSSNRWFRVVLNQGCLRGAGPIQRMEVSLAPGIARLQRNASLTLDDLGVPRNCLVSSIRRSVAPPQVDSKSPITLD